MILDNKTILVTGGTGSFGQKFIRTALNDYYPKAIRVFSRDELKQWEMQRRFNRDPRLRFFIGDVRDKSRLDRALEGVDIVIHAAALKHVPVCEYNPFEAVKTNVLGAQNVINASLDNNVEKVIGISTDKAVNPVNLYGATKMCMEKIFIAANSYVGRRKNTKISCVRYGNVVGSRGSVVQLFLKQKSSGKVTLTDKQMTRFWITIEQGVSFVIKSIKRMRGGEIFIPKLPSMSILDVAGVIAPKCSVEYIGIRAAEKIHECLLTDEEARHGVEFPDYYVILPQHPWWSKKYYGKAKTLATDFKYASNSNRKWLSQKDLQKILKDHLN